MCLINYIEMARVTGVPISYLSTRGQQIKVGRTIDEYFKLRNFFYCQPVLNGCLLYYIDL